MKIATLCALLGAASAQKINQKFGDSNCRGLIDEISKSKIQYNMAFK
jgi:hypothetical protein